MILPFFAGPALNVLLNICLPSAPPTITRIYMRTFADRVRHALLFEAVALAIFIPGSAVLFDQPVQDMGVIGIFSATIATLWNFVFNVGFDRAMLRLRGSVEKTMAIRVTHTFLFEAGLVAMLIPLIAWYLGIGLWAALLMDIAIVTFYLVYGFLFNLAYDRLFPVASVAAPAQPC
jgi:uncharacterized membrane protein